MFVQDGSAGGQTPDTDHAAVDCVDAQTARGLRTQSQEALRVQGEPKCHLGQPEHDCTEGHHVSTLVE